MSTAAQSSHAADTAGSADASEVVYRNDRTLITRRTVAGQPLICKQALGTLAIRRLRSERAMLERVAGVPGVARLAEGATRSDSLLMHDDGGEPLSRSFNGQPMPIDEVLRLGQALAHVLSGVHAVGVVHRDVNPSNVLIAGRDRRPILIDFNIASGVGEEAADLSHQRRIEGTLAYMAPEQTGRTGRPVDQRSDLYALGVLLYEALTGRLPFAGDDLLAMVHAHLTQLPASPAEVQPAVPEMLSRVVMRLLEKEPDRRYQSADGLAHDLARIERQRAAGGEGKFPLGERDFAWRLAAPSRPVGREREITALTSALDAAIATAGSSLSIEGEAGAGKSALMNELRAAVAARHGWFVPVRFGAGEREQVSAAVQVLRSLGGLLLSQPDTELTRQRSHLLAALGTHVGTVSAVAPELVALLGGEAEPVAMNAHDQDKRAAQAALDLVRAIASPQRPLVLALDDQQWAGLESLRFLAAAQAAAPRVSGLLVAAAWRPGTSEAPDDLLETLHNAPATHIALPALDLAQTTELAAQMLRLPPQQAEDLAQVLISRTGGNPQDSIEFINTLRHDGVLRAGDEGWSWDEAAARRHVAEHGRADLLALRLQALPAACGVLLDTLALLGGQANSVLLALAAARGEQAAIDTLASAVDDGLLVAQATDEGLDYGFRNSRVQQAVQERLDPSETAQMHLVLARRLDASARHRDHAAQRYLQALSALQEPDECRRAAALLAGAAHVRELTQPALAERMLAGALQALLQVEQASDGPQLRQLHEAHHEALYALGRFDEADQAYEALALRCSQVEQVVHAIGIQLTSLTQRGHSSRALALGLQTLGRLGLALPQDYAAAVPAGLARLCAWAEGSEREADLQRPDMSEPQRVAQALVIARTMTPAFHANKAVYAWLAMEGQRLWAAHGPSPLLAGTLGSTPSLLISMLRNYKAAFGVARHIVRVGEARAWGRHNAMPRLLYGSWAAHWFEPLEHALVETRRGRDELTASGEEKFASFGYSLTSLQVFETAPTLDDTWDEAGAALGRAHEKDNINDSVTVLFRQLVRSLRGETRGGAGSFNDDGFDEVASLRDGRIASTAGDTFKVLRTLTALVYNDYATADSAVRTEAIFNDPGFYAGSLAHVFLAMVVAHRLRLSGEDRNPEDLALLQRMHQWLGERAADAPANYGHLLRLVDAERAWALGDTWAAGQAYEAAMREAEARHRPWHRAWIFERAGRFWLAQRLQRSARPLLAEAMRLYDAWGAHGKVRALMEEFPYLRNESGHRRSTQSTQSTMVSGDMVDMMAILQASQALSSETSLSRLNQRVAKIIGAMAGAPSVLLVVRPEAGGEWFLASSLGPQGQPVPVEAAAQHGRLVLPAFRYVTRTLQPLLLEDARHDDRFARDPALAAAEHCSLLYVPLLSQGELRAMLLLENRQRPGAFTADRLDTLTLVAGQLSVSLDNALLYASLERKVAERTAELEEANRMLQRLSVTDALTGLANRRRFNDAFDAEWIRARRHGSPIGMALIDIDQFKLYNDHYGHQGGDACLQLVAQAMAGMVRHGIDLIARYGGEEFVLLLPNTDLAGARVVAERVREAVAAKAAPHEKSLHGQVTISVGVASATPAQVAKPTELIELADAALYEAKRQGRNRVESAAAELP